jgi:hypothetical protein
MEGGKLVMSAVSSSIDATTKRWLVVLAAAILASIAILTHSFIRVLAPPPEESVTTQPPVADAAREVRTSRQEEWSRPQQFRAFEEQPATANHFSSNNSDPAQRKKDKAARQEMAHIQAENLRSMAKQNNLPKAFGHLTVEQINEMEKKGIIIE